MPLLRFSEGMPLAFSLKMDYKSKDDVKITASGQTEGEKFTGLLGRRSWRSTCYSSSWRVYFWVVPIRPGANLTVRQWRELDWVKLREGDVVTMMGLPQSEQRNSVMDVKVYNYAYGKRCCIDYLKGSERQRLPLKLPLSWLSDGLASIRSTHQPTKHSCQLRRYSGSLHHRLPKFSPPPISVTAMAIISSSLPFSKDFRDTAPQKRSQGPIGAGIGQGCRLIGLIGLRRPKP